MTQHTLFVAGLKGGVGKSTTAVHLAAAAHLAGFSTLLVDLDSQGSVTRWNAWRPEGGPLAGLVVTKQDEALKLSRFRELGAPYDVVILDGPPRLGEISRAAAKYADTIVMPVQPGAFDLAATQQTLDLLDAVEDDRSEDRPPLRRTFVLSRAVVGTAVARQAPSLIEGAGEILGVFHQRLSFSDAISNGETVLTAKASSVDAKAAFEVRTVARALGLTAAAKAVRA